MDSTDEEPSQTSEREGFDDGVARSSPVHPDILDSKWLFTVKSKTYCEFWTLSASTFVSTIHLAAGNDADEDNNNAGKDSKHNDLVSDSGKSPNETRSTSNDMYASDYAFNLSNTLAGEQLTKFVKTEVWKSVHNKESSQFEELQKSLRAILNHHRRSARTLQHSKETSRNDALCCCLKLADLYYVLHNYMHPESTFRYVWTILCFLGVTFNAFSVPAAIGFMFSGRYSILLPAIFVDIFFIVDIILNLTCFTYYDPDSGIVESSLQKISKRYMESSSFKIDIIAALPLDVFALLAPDNGTRILILPLLRLVKIVRVSHLYEYFANIETLVVERSRKCTTAVRRLVRLYFLLVVVLHWVACGWYLCGQLSSRLGYESNWIQSDEDNPNRSINTASSEIGFIGYLRALYFVLVGASTVGYGDIVPTNVVETVYATVAMLFGGLLKPAVVGGIAALVFSAISRELPVYKYAESLIRFAQRHGRSLPIAFTEQVTRYADYLNDRPSLYSEASILRDLPPALRAEVLNVGVGCIVKSLPFLKYLGDLDREFLDDLVAACKPRHYLPTDIILYEGEFGHSMFFLCSGQAQVTVGVSNLPVSNIEKGQYFGETALLTVHAIRTATVTAKSYCDCFVLGRVAFHRIISAYGIDRRAVEVAIVLNLRNKMKEKHKCFTDGDELSLSMKTGLKLSNESDNAEANRLETIMKIDSPSSSRKETEQLVSPKTSFTTIKGEGGAQQQSDGEGSLSGSEADDEETAYNEDTDIVTHVISHGSNLSSRRPSLRAESIFHHEDEEKGGIQKQTVDAVNRDQSFSLGIRDLQSWRHPNSKFRHRWNICLFLGVCYYLIVVPIRIAFLDGVIGFQLHAIDWCLDIAFILDVFFRAKRFSFFRSGRLIKSNEEIFDAYWKRGFMWQDIVTCAPLDIFALILIPFVTSHNDHALLVLALLRMPKLLHTNRLFHLTNVRGLFGLFALIAMIANVCACCFYLVAKAYSTANIQDIAACVSEHKFISVSNSSQLVQNNNTVFESDSLAKELEFSCTWNGTWVMLQVTDGLLQSSGSTDLVRWLRSFNWAMPTLLVVVIGDATPVNFGETVYVSLIILFGLIVNAMVLGVMADRLTDTNSERSRHRLNMDMVERWLIISGVADHVLLCDRIRDHMKYTFAITKGLDEARVMSMMPHQLRHNAAKYLRVPQLESSFVFSNCSKAFLQALSESLIIRHYSGGDIICVKGEYMSEMFFVQRGVVEIFTESTLDKSQSSSSNRSHSSDDEEKSSNGSRSQIQNPSLSSVAGVDTNEHHKAAATRIVNIGESFGAAAMVGHVPSSIFAHAVDHVMVLVLKHSSFKDILFQFPDEKEKIPHLQNLTRSDSLPIFSLPGEPKEETKSNSVVSNDVTELPDNYSNSSEEFIAHTSSAYHAKWNSWTGRWQLHSLFRDIWDTISLFNLVYLAVVIPVRIAILIEDRVSSSELVLWYVFDYLVDIFFLVDMFLQASKFHTVQDDRVIDQPSEIWKQYTSWEGRHSHVVDDDKALTHTSSGHAKFISASDSIKHREKLQSSVESQNERHICDRINGCMYLAYTDCSTFVFSDFFIDLMSCMPLDLIAIFAGAVGSSGIVWLKWLRLNRLIRFYKHANRLCDSVDRFLHQRFHIWSGFYILMAKVWFLFFLVNHLAACMWIIIHRYMERNEPKTWATVDGVATFNSTSGEHNIFHDRSYTYLRSFYFVTVVVSTCGYGDIRPYTNLETVFAQVVTLCGALGLASMVGTFLYYFQ